MRNDEIEKGIVLIESLESALTRIGPKISLTNKKNTLINYPG
jgi:hypothetical protein